jgi:hypothetical protein
VIAEFQQALADLTASPALCRRARQEPSFLRQHYQLSDREFRRLIGIVEHPGMEGACMVYRANRLAPLAVNVRETCRALGPQLRSFVEEFWTAYPETNVHFIAEADRFCRFMQTKIVQGAAVPQRVEQALACESAVVAAALAETYLEGPSEI